MPYRSIKELPSSIKEHLPKEAQEIYLKVFNSAYSQYTNEESAFRVAWHAVKQKYHKTSSGKWVKNK